MSNVYFDVNSQKDCIMMLKNYYNGNSYQVTNEDMEAMEDRWGDAKMQNFRRLAQQQSSDVTQYQISDDDADEAYNQGKENIQDATGYKRTTGDDVKQVGGTVISGVGGAAAGAAGIVNGAPIVTGLAAKAGIGSGAKAAGGVLGKVGGIIGCAIAAANVALYLIRKPNQEEAKVLGDMQSEMANAGNETLNAQGEMDALAEEIEEQTITAEKNNTEHQNEIDTAYADYATYNPVITEIEAKIAGGETLTDAEKQQYTDALKYSQEAGVTIDKNSTAATEEIGEIYGEIDGNIAEFDDSAKIMQETQAKVDVSAEFDQKTVDCANVEQISQTVGGISAFASAAKALGEGIPGYIAAAVGAAAGLAQMGFASKQGEYSNTAAAEVDLRVQTDDINKQSIDVYDEKLTASVGNLDYVGNDLETEIPDDVEDHEEIAQAPQTNTTNDTTNPNLFVNPEEEEKEET